MDDPDTRNALLRFIDQQGRRTRDLPQDIDSRRFEEEGLRLWIAVSQEVAGEWHVGYFSATRRRLYWSRAAYDLENK